MTPPAAPRICQCMLATTGGSSTVAIQLGEALGERGFGVCYCHTDPRATGLAAAAVLTPARAAWIAEALDVDRALCGALEVSSQLVEAYDTAPFDLLHLHSLQVFGVPAALLRRLRGVPYVVTMHGSDVFNDRFFDLNRPLVEGLLRDAAAVTCVSTPLADELRRKLPDLLPPPVVVHNFLRADLPATPWQRRPTAAPQVLHVSSLRPVKRPELVLAAFARLRRRCPAARLTLVSDRDGAARGERLLAAFADRDAVRLRHGGRDPDLLSRAYREADVLVLASRFEGFGLVILEALAHGLPVVAPAVGGIREILGESWPWLVHERLDDPRAYAEKLAMAAANPPAPATVTAILERFARDPQVDRYCSIYRHALAATDRQP